MDLLKKFQMKSFQKTNKTSKAKQKNPEKAISKLHKQQCRAASPSFAASLEPLVYRRNMTSVILFYMGWEIFN